MYYVTLAGLSTRVLPQPVVELLGNHCFLVAENTPAVVGCREREAVSAVISVVTRAELPLADIRVSGRRPDQRAAAD